MNDEIDIIHQRRECINGNLEVNLQENGYLEVLDDR